MKSIYFNNRRKSVLALVLGGCLSLASSAHADTFTVINTAGNSDPGSLRAAIVNANATTGFDLITFSPTLNGATIELDGSGQIVITDNVEIDAGDLPLGVTILGGANNARVVSIYEDAMTMTFPEVSLTNLTITGGNNGGSGGGIEQQGGSLLLTDVTVAGNSGSDGGGLWAEAGNLTIRNCTFANNSASYGGGAIWTETGVSVSIENTTITANISPLGCAFYLNGTGPVSLNHCTIVGNPGSIAVQIANANADLTIENSIVAENGDGNPDFYLESGATLTAAGVNLIGRNDGVETIFPEGPLVGTVASPLSPQFSFLTENGGFTETMLPLANSPALNAAPTGLATDQRGVARPQGPGFDLGAVEVVVGNTSNTAAIRKQLASAKKGLTRAKKLFKKAASSTKKAAAKKSIKKFAKKIKSLTKTLAAL